MSDICECVFIIQMILKNTITVDYLPSSLSPPGPPKVPSQPHPSNPPDNERGGGLAVHFTVLVTVLVTVIVLAFLAFLVVHYVDYRMQRKQRYENEVCPLSIQRVEDYVCETSAECGTCLMLVASSAPMAQDQIEGVFMN